MRAIISWCLQKNNKRHEKTEQCSVFLVLTGSVWYTDVKGGGGMKTCPNCGKPLPSEMQFCPYCMQKLIEEQVITPPPVKRRVWPWIVIAAVICAAIGAVIALRNVPPQVSPASGGGETVTTTATAAQTTTGPAYSVATTTTALETTTTKRETTATVSTTTVTIDPCIAGHDWTTVTQTVNHKEQGHYEDVLVRYEEAMVYECAVCYDDYLTLDEYYLHFDEHLKTSDSLVGVLRERYEVETALIPVYENQWVVDKAAYTETVVVGQKCRCCGAEK